jgi:hypothetical protein
MRRPLVKLHATFTAALLLGCTAPQDVQEVLDVEPASVEPATEPEFVIIPAVAKTPADLPPPTLEAPPAPLPTPARWEMWQIREDINAWLVDEVALAACDVELPQFPTIAADGSVIAIALLSSPVADERLLTIRLLRTQDAKQMRAYTLVGPGEFELPSEELQRRICHRAIPLARAMASGGHTSMPVVGGWDNPIRDGLPASVENWPRVISDGATRDVDMAVTDILIAPANSDAPELRVREAGPKKCRGSSGQFSKVWEAGGLRVFTRGPCGC